jgi:hypothetical protein
MGAKLTPEQKSANKIRILKGIPYTEEGLRALHFTALSTLLSTLKVNPFKLEDKSIAGKIKAILENQSKYKG